MLKEKLLWLVTCTSLEIMTALGVTFYLIYLEEHTLALIASVIFAKVIAFHFIMDIHDKIKQKRIHVQNSSIILS